MTSSHYSFILWKVEIVYWCDGNSELRKFGDCTVYHDSGWGAPEIKDLLEQFCQKKGEVLHLALSIEKVVFFIGKRPFLGLYITVVIKALHLLMIF